MKTVHPSPLLKNALRADALVSAATGVLQLAAADKLAMLLDLPRGLLSGSGEFFLAYAGVLLVMAGRLRLPSWAVVFIVLGNLLWGVACVALPIEGVLAPNALGWGFLGIQAAAVATFAVLEWLGLRNSATAAAAGERQQRQAHGSAL